MKDAFDPEIWAARARIAADAPTLLVPNPPPSAEDAEIDRLAAQVAELRAVLAPLLDKPEDPCDAYFCVFCHEAIGRGRDPDPHLEDCPVLRKDALLGR